ncbi:arabinose-5-phosphate isomerase [Planctomycetota bacterium]|nr:KpsF/GutQ family sugar-phosphate isomerase [Planctomycetota bacterium]MSR38572.1 KpsF/GutQ family sugar-phosphate isomerase [Planctomycetota bacterium]GDY01760.1 arabinose-5-phosphate isomerase [Planctomycetota bacterium]
MDPRIERARNIVEREADAVRQVAGRIGADFAHVVDLALQLKGRIVTAGMGKAGIIASKISATLASTGTPSIFLHPAEAIHGDLGRVEKGDLVLAFSKSGETAELLVLLPHVKAAAVPIVSVTQSRNSTLGRHSDVVLELGPIDEVGPYGLAPSASTTAMLALGDAFALVVQEGRNFGPQDFARFHPGGDLGRRLMRVGELMRRGEHNPKVQSGCTLLHAIEVMTRTPGRPGATSVIDAHDKLIGFFTDGDLRRLIEHGLQSPREIRIDTVMTVGPRSISDETFALEALALMRQFAVDQLPIIDGNGHLIGLLDVQDLLNLKIG